MKNLKIVLFFVVIGLILGIAVYAEGISAYPTYTKGEFKISAKSLTEAGFTGVKEKAVKNTSAYFPNYYFTVNEPATPGEVCLEWGEADQLVAIFVRKMPTDWVYNNGNVDSREYCLKTQVRASKPGYYFVVTASDKEKAFTLLANLRAAY
jgi:hypothetical protein